MRNALICVLALAGSGLIGGCASEIDPTDFPYRLEETYRKNRPVRFVDLDQDGQADEMHVLQKPDAEYSAVKLRVHEGRVIEQVNFAGDLAPNIQFLDLQQDGQMEVLVPVVRHDSLFLSVVGAEGTKKMKLFVAEGEPRREPEGTIPWDPDVREVYRADANGDGEPELITVMMTRLARKPRGIWVHDLQTGERLFSWTSGAMVDAFALRDIENDGTLDFIGATAASNNGATGGGLDDRHAYLFRLSLNSGSGRTPQLIWKRRLGGLWARSRLRVGDINGDGAEEWVGFRRHSEGRPKSGRLEVFDPATGETDRHVSLPPAVQHVELADLNGDGTDQIVVWYRSGRLETRGPALRVQQSRTVEADAKNLDAARGLGANRGDLLFAQTRASTRVLGPGLSTEAYLPEAGKAWRKFPATQAGPPRAVLRSETETAVYAYRETPAYLLYRYGPWALGLLGIGLVLGVGYGAWRGYRRYREVRALSDRIRQAVDDRLFLADRNGTLEPLNDPAWQLLHHGGEDPDPGDAPDGRSPLTDRLTKWIKSLEVQPVQVHVTELDRLDGDTRVRAWVHPFHVSSSPKEVSTWLLRIKRPDGRKAAEESRTWRLMAQRVAHDLRNPLTSIRLALQNMQMDYREADPEIAATLDAQVEEIEGQIESLRRTATNVMKLAGAEEQNFLETNLSSFLRRKTKQFATNLSDDVNLRRELANDLPRVAIDREQMNSVLENLLYNAVEALPEGGTIIVQTRLARNLSLTADVSSQDYVLMEVMDTGVGMDAATRARAFDPGFTTMGQGTGLGLAIVKRVVEAHGGQVELESEPEMGTDVRVYLPVTEGT